MANEVRTQAFTAMCEQGAGLTATSYEDFLLNEIGRALEGAIRNTASASVAKIKARYSEFVPMGIDAYSPKRARRSGNLIGGVNLAYYMKNRYSNELWQRLQARKTQLVERKRAARGLAKKSWLDLAQALGITIEVPGYVSDAIASTGKTYDNVSVSKELKPGQIRIKIRNAQPTVVNIGGARALQQAMDGRVKFFHRNAENAVFADIKKMIRQYPGLKLKEAA